MTEFTVKLADIPIGICALYEVTIEAYREYLTEDSPVFSLTVTDRELKKEEDLLAGRLRMTPSALEKQWIYRQVGERLPEFGALLVHGSAVAVDGNAYLFTAPSGTGKSTHARLWRQYLGDRAVMINDDKPLLKFEKDSVLVCGSPWSGKHRLGTNMTAPLKGICLLSRDAHNSIATASIEQDFPALLQQFYRPEDAQRTAQTLTLIDRLLQTVPLYRLRCNMDLDAAQIAYDGLNGGKV